MSLRAGEDRGFRRRTPAKQSAEKVFLCLLSADCFAKENCAPDDDFVARNDDSDGAEILNLLALRKGLD